MFIMENGPSCKIISSVVVIWKAGSYALVATTLHPVSQTSFYLVNRFPLYLSIRKNNPFN